MTIFKGFKKAKATMGKLVDKPVEKPVDKLVEKSNSADIDARTIAEKKAEAVAQKTQNKDESGGPKGLEPTRYGDWEKSGRCIDF